MEYRHNLPPEPEAALSLRANITDISRHDANTIVVHADYEGHPELRDTAVFEVTLVGDLLDLVSFAFYEPHKGAYHDLPMTSAEKAVFEALVRDHRAELDALRSDMSKESK